MYSMVIYLRLYIRLDGTQPTNVFLLMVNAEYDNPL